MDWITGLAHTRTEGTPGVIATIIEVRGHSPRDVGAKMFVTKESAWGSIGGGNMEATVTDRARSIISAGADAIEYAEFGLNEHAHVTFGTQCCGGAVRVLLEPVGQRATVAVFGMGHVGKEIAWILSRHSLILHLTDSRASVIDDSLVDQLETGSASVNVHTLPAPEMLMKDLPQGTHVLILTHDHSEDLILCDAALRRDDLGSIGVIGSAAKWARFRMKLKQDGHSEAAIERIQCPIGEPDIAGKQPAVIAVSVAADLMRKFQHVTV